jgi:hypothetical protein
MVKITLTLKGSAFFGGGGGANSVCAVENIDRVGRQQGEVHLDDLEV